MRPLLQPNSYQSHLETAHGIWRNIVLPGDIVIDATCGNGHDTLFLANLLLQNGTLYALDIQPEAIAKSRQSIEEAFSKEVCARIKFVEGCHSKFPSEIQSGSVKLIVYNLGYLPGGDKALTTQLQTTLESVTSALELLTTGGMISITCYPGHDEGMIEEKALVEFAAKLDSKTWICSHQRWINRQRAPSLLLISRRKG